MGSKRKRSPQAPAATGRGGGRPGIFGAADVAAAAARARALKQEREQQIMQQKRQKQEQKQKQKQKVPPLEPPAKKAKGAMADKEKHFREEDAKTRNVATWQFSSPTFTRDGCLYYLLLMGSD